MRLFRRSRTFAILGASVVLASCLPFEPCGFSGPSIFGTWRIVSVNGQPIPAGGYPLPSSSDRLIAGTLTFEARDLDNCVDEERIFTNENGVVVSEYTLATAAGVPKTPRLYGGSYDHDTKTTFVQVAADGHSAFGLHSASGGTITFSGTLPSLGGLTVVFRRGQ